MWEQSGVWRTPEELVAIGLRRSRVVMMNEAHHGLTRCARTRLVGRRILPVAHASGVRYLTMEALSRREDMLEANATRRLPASEHGYLAQPEMRALIQDALDLGWTLIAYEIELSEPPDDPMSQEFTNRRELEQARNLTAAMAALPDAAKLLVWCGNSHHSKTGSPDWRPMGYQFSRLSGINPFVIDQTQTVAFPIESAAWIRARLARIEGFRAQLAAHDGTAGFLAEEGPPGCQVPTGSDAYIFSLDNELE